MEARSSLPAHLSDLTTRWRPSASPSRRLRFEDETETDAESRYLDRQLHRRGQQKTGVLVSKLDLNQFNNIQSGARGTQPDRQQRGRAALKATRPIESGGQLDLRLKQHPPVTQVKGSGLNWPHLHVRTELLKDSYIGCISPADSGEGGDEAVSKPVRCRANRTGGSGNQETALQAKPTGEIPVNPYPLMMSEKGRPHGTITGKDLSQNQEEQRKPSVTGPHQEAPSCSDLKNRTSCLSSGEETILTV